MTRIETGLRYCTAHEGVVEVDRDDCDWRRDMDCEPCEGSGFMPDDEPCAVCDGAGYTPCVTHPMFYERPDGGPDEAEEAAEEIEALRASVGTLASDLSWCIGVLEVIATDADGEHPRLPHLRDAVRRALGVDDPGRSEDEARRAAPEHGGEGR